MAEKVFRNKDEVGIDYKCSVCGCTGRRLWRDSNIMLDSIDLYCAECAATAQREKIEEYIKSGISDPDDLLSCTIGNLLPARPTPDGSTFWGHSSGDTAWWYRLQAYADPVKESALIIAERNHFARQSEDYGGRWLDELERSDQAIRDRDDALRAAKLEYYPK